MMMSNAWARRLSQPCDRSATMYWGKGIMLSEARSDHPPPAQQARQMQPGWDEVFEVPIAEPGAGDAVQ
jgi:hypothetical protein